MPPHTFIHAFEVARTTAGGREVGGSGITLPYSRKLLKINRRNSESRAMLASALPSRDGGRPKANENDAFCMLVFSPVYNQ